jgi:hypothetical protein
MDYPHCDKRWGFLIYGHICTGVFYRRSLGAVILVGHLKLLTADVRLRSFQMAAVTPTFEISRRIWVEEHPKCPHFIARQGREIIRALKKRVTARNAFALVAPDAAGAPARGAPRGI